MNTWTDPTDLREELEDVQVWLDDEVIHTPVGAPIRDRLAHAGENSRRNAADYRLLTEGVGKAWDQVPDDITADTLADAVRQLREQRDDLHRKLADEVDAIGALWDAVRGDARAKSAVTAVETLIAQRDEAQQSLRDAWNALPQLFTIGFGSLAQSIKMALKSTQTITDRDVEKTIGDAVRGDSRATDALSCAATLVAQRDEARQEAENLRRGQPMSVTLESTDTMTAAEALALVAKRVDIVVAMFAELSASGWGHQRRIETLLASLANLTGFVDGLRAGLGGAE